MKYFISYTEADEDHAIWIARVLESAGHTTKYMGRDSRPGADFIDMMNDAIDNYDRLILVMSDDYFAGTYTEDEWKAFYIKEKETEEDEDLIFPVRFEEVNPKGLLKSRVFIDLSEVAGELERVQALVDGIGDTWKPEIFEQYKTNPLPKKAEQSTSEKPAIQDFAERTGYFLDRDEVIIRLAKLFERQSQDINPKPVLCIIHGDKSQGHDMLRERLEIEIPKLLGTQDVGVLSKYLAWPNPTNVLQGSAFHDFIESKLSFELIDKLKPLDELRSWASLSPAPLIVFSNLSVSTWREALNEALIKQYLAFWELWAKKPCHQQVVVILQIVYDADMHFSLKERLLGNTAEKVNNGVKAMLMNLKVQHQNVIFEVLPPLKDVTEQDVENVVNSDKLTGNLKRIHPHIYTMFDNRQKLSMEEAVTAMTKALEKVNVGVA